MNIIDTHCHLDFAAFDADRDEVFQRARINGLIGFVIPAVKQSSWQALIELCAQYNNVYYALGLHPIFIREHQSDDVQLLRDCVELSQPIAIGEIGLDFYDRSLALEKQLGLFQQQLAVACDVELPVILHVRKAHQEVLACLEKYPVTGGVVHAFNGSMQLAERYMTHNFKFGFGGMLTFERSSKLRKLAKQLPLESIVLETDSPDMTVEAHRGQRNSPEYLPDCLAALAQVREMDVDIVAEQTTRNAYELFERMRQ